MSWFWSGRGAWTWNGQWRWRNRKHRNIWFVHKSRFFKPSGVPMSELEEVTLKEDEMETLRLKNIAWLDIVQWAEKMEISKSTFARIYNDAVAKMSDALINGKAIKIEK